ncbi:MAG: PhnA domain-containing protein [Ferruginibacter sp.]
MMPIAISLKDRCQSLCELCGTGEASVAYAVSPNNHDLIENEMALCVTCHECIAQNTGEQHWRCLAGSIWNPEPSVQAMSYRILFGMKTHAWAAELLQSVELDEAVVDWAMAAYDKPDVHVDGHGNILETGDTVLLTQGLNVKGANFTALKGTIIKRIRLVPENTDQIEGKINDQVIVILTKFVRKQLS